MSESNAMPIKCAESRSWPKRFLIAVLRPFYVILLAPLARPMARRLRAFFLIPMTEQMRSLRHDLAELDLKLGAIILTLQTLQGKVEDGEQGVRQSLQRLQSDTDALRESMQRLEGGANDIRRDVKNEISAVGRSIQAVLASLSVASERA